MSCSSGSSTTTKAPAPDPSAYVTFVGPNSDNIVFFKDAQGNHIPCFKVEISKHSEPNIRIFRILQDGSRVPFAEATTSSVSGNCTVSLHGRDDELKLTYNPSIYGHSMETTMGKMNWVPGGTWGERLDLVDKQKTKLAKYKMMSASGNELKLDIMVQVDNAIVETILACGLALKAATEKGNDQALKGLKIFSKLAGVL